MDKEQRLNLILRGTEEVITEDELKQLLETTNSPKAYWGFEPSGGMHIGTGLVCGGKIRDMADAGCKFTIFLADWHAWINNKLGGDFANIRLCGEYFKRCFAGVGIVSENVTYSFGSEIERGLDYWEKVIRIAKSNSAKRIRRALPIMGREDAEDIETAALIYPCMQAADIFQLDLDIACAGIDQRKAHIIARESASKLQKRKPISVPHPPSCSAYWVDHRAHPGWLPRGVLMRIRNMTLRWEARWQRVFPGVRFSFTMSPKKFVTRSDPAIVLPEKSKTTLS